MNFMNKTVAVIGATGVVGSGIVRRYMDVGATVICVSRRQENLTKLRAELAPDGGKSLVEVVADFNDEEAAQEAGRAVVRALKGDSLNHVVCVQGFVESSGAPSETPVLEVSCALQDGLYNNFLAAKTFLPVLKDRDGSSLTLVSGGLAHEPPSFPRDLAGDP